MSVQQDSDLSDIEIDEEVLKRYAKERFNKLQKQSESAKSGLIAFQGKERDLVGKIAHEPYCVIFFAKDEFKRCNLMELHLKIIAERQPSTHFYKVQAEEMPFLVGKFSVKSLPTVIVFKEGQAIDCIVGFEEVGNCDDFATTTLEKRLIFF